MKNLVCGLLAVAAFSANAFDIKGYSLGQPMTECPPGSSRIEDRRPITSCSLGATTVANQPATDFVVGFYEGRVVTVFLELQERGQSANIAVREALIEKFGVVNRAFTKTHINQYGWIRDNTFMLLDGWKGNLILQDAEAHKRAQRQSAATNKNDL